MKYKDIDNINIERLKRIQGWNLLRYIDENKIDIEDIACDLGISKEKLIQILSSTNESKGSEILLISNHIKSLKKDKLK